LPVAAHAVGTAYLWMTADNRLSLQQPGGRIADEKLGIGHRRAGQCAGISSALIKPPSPWIMPRPVAGPSAPPHPASRAGIGICEADVSPRHASERERPPDASSPPTRCS
jgi:hypothetical protein